MRSNASTPAVSDELTVEATGETVGEAKWAALRELEQRYPALGPAPGDYVRG